MRSFAELGRFPSEYKDAGNLYRTFGIERLFQLLTERKLTLLAPEKWEDPYEKALQELATGQKLSERPSVFGLCWSMQGRSDALWRIYSPNTLGVRISTTVDRLLLALTPKATSGINSENLYLGRVTYLPESSKRAELFDFGKFPLGLTADDFDRPIRTIADAIEDMKERAESKLVNRKDIAKALFVKRTAFEHEKEVRLLYVDQATTAGDSADVGGLLKLEVDPFKLIRGIQFDPRLSDDIFQALRATVRSVLGSSSIRVTKSTLYKSPLEIIADRRK